MKINIAIDGPSGAGKSTVADILAEKLSYIHLDTGAMYRSLAYLTLEKGIGLNEEDKIVSLIDNDFNLDMRSDGTIYCNGIDLTNKIRINEISMAASDISKLNGVRKGLVKVQKEIARDGGYIVDGRDICEVVLPDAKVKIYLTANPEDRARRRVLQNKEKGIDSDYITILEDIKKRDYQDMHREFSPLRKTEDAILIDSSNLSIKEVVDKILEIAYREMGGLW